MKAADKKVFEKALQDALDLAAVDLTYRARKAILNAAEAEIDKDDIEARVKELEKKFSVVGKVKAAK